MGDPIGPTASRRAFCGAAAGVLISPWAARVAPAAVVPEGARPAITHGVASGDVAADGTAVVWARADRPARLIVEWSTTDSFRDARRAAGPDAIEPDDFTARVVLRGLPPGQTIVYRARFDDLAEPGLRGLPVAGRFRTPPAPDDRRAVTLAWGGDTAGQGWGIDPARGGMLTYRSMLAADPDLFIHSGDAIYADGPIAAEVALDDGTTWNNLTTPETSKVAETLDEFRGRYRYNLLDDHARAFAAGVAQVVQWDDHETTNNWYPGEILPDDGRYAVRSASLLAARGRRAFLEYTPIRRDFAEAGRIYRRIVYGPHLDVLVIDQRSYRGPNSANRQPTASAATAFLGRRQLAWLKRSLATSRATWKVIASDMPIGLVVGDGPDAFEALANADPGAPLGRELELADLLAWMKAQSIRNVVWLTADVHYAAAHHYDPARASFADFDPYWEFVAGPLHAGTFGPNPLDPTFGPEVRYCSVPVSMRPNRPPSADLQFFGLARANPDSTIAVTLHDRRGVKLYGVDLEPARV